jgi:hypothetical protein
MPTEDVSYNQYASKFENATAQRADASSAPWPQPRGTDRVAEGLGDVVEQGQTVAVSPTAHELTTAHLFELADEVRNDIEPEPNIVWA